MREKLLRNQCVVHPPRARCTRPASLVNQVPAVSQSPVSAFVKLKANSTGADFAVLAEGFLKMNKVASY